jgi:hypothetical protein
VLQTRRNLFQRNKIKFSSFHATHSYEIIFQSKSTPLLELVAACDEMQDTCAEVNGFQDQTSVEILHDLVATPVFPCYELMKGSAGGSVECDEGRTLNTNSQTQQIFSRNASR